ncbi:AzlD family protein [Ahrensia sp. R2A130]|uniref:AzlD family protein n=1 Tax=Ahrensia sp. R2A130 TaxID=744979 RepID=UPI0001E0C9BD|nr:AzlD domain-containing protein [Ahrensia sp. R2A130]EFL90830.1 branched-chain amino acid transport [Ahrensia sp. R2A130]
MFEQLDWYLMLVVLVGSAVTLVNRLAGHYILARFEPIPYRVEAALEAVPVAVMTTLVVPAAINGAFPEWVALAVAFVLGLRLHFLIAVLGGITVLLLMRQAGL